MSEIAGLFAGMGLLVISLAIAYIFYLIGRMLRMAMDRDIKFDLIQEAMIDKFAEKKGMDLNKMMAKKELFKKAKETKSIRTRLHDEIYDDLFGKAKGKD